MDPMYVQFKPPQICLCVENFQKGELLGVNSFIRKLDTSILTKILDADLNINEFEHDDYTINAEKDAFEVFDKKNQLKFELERGFLARILTDLIELEAKFEVLCKSKTFTYLYPLESKDKSMSDINDEQAVNSNDSGFVGHIGMVSEDDDSEEPAPPVLKAPSMFERKAEPGNASPASKNLIEFQSSATVSDIIKESNVPATATPISTPAPAVSAPVAFNAPSMFAKETVPSTVYKSKTPVDQFNKTSTPKSPFKESNIPAPQVISTPASAFQEPVRHESPMSDIKINLEEQFFQTTPPKVKCNWITLLQELTQKVYKAAPSYTTAKEGLGFVATVEVNVTGTVQKFDSPTRLAKKQDAKQSAAEVAYTALKSITGGVEAEHEDRNKLLAWHIRKSIPHPSYNTTTISPFRSTVTYDTDKTKTSDGEHQKKIAEKKAASLAWREIQSRPQFY